MSKGVFPLLAQLYTEKTISLLSKSLAYAENLGPRWPDSPSHLPPNSITIAPCSLRFH